MGERLEVVALDIETTGFTVRDEVTVLGVVLPLGCRVFAQRPPNTSVHPDQLAATLTERADTHVSLSVHDSEADLLGTVGAFAADRLRADDVLLVAYNGETYRGGFDLPFLRTRLARQDIAWPFTDLAYADVMPVVTKRFNTTAPTAGDAGRDDEDATPSRGASRAALPDVYDVLVDGAAGDLDPFTESAAAVEAFQQGDLEALLAHNLADILRTQALGELTEDYCGTSDMSVKSLTPTVEAFDDNGREPSTTGHGGGSADAS